ncbi:MAG: PEP-CTERM sorting domain-containing protein [Gemmatimonadota bacterium]
MRTQRFARLAAALLLIGLLPQRALAQFTVYTSLASFLAATTGAGTDTFEDLSITTATPAPLARTAGSFGYTASVNTTSFFGAGSAADRWLSTNTTTDIITFNGFGPGVRGVGGLFFGTDAAGAFRPASSIVLVARTASGMSTRTVLDATLATFVGFVASADLISLTVEAVQPLSGSAFAWPTVNNLVLAGAPAMNVVPEPATWLMMVTGFGMMVLVVTGRRRKV